MEYVGETADAVFAVLQTSEESSRERREVFGV